MSQWFEHQDSPVYRMAVLGRYRELVAIEEAQRAPARKKTPPKPPKLYADGIRDDTYGVQWYIDHDVELPLPLSAYKLDYGKLRAKPGTFGDGIPNPFMTPNDPMQVTL